MDEFPSVSNLAVELRGAIADKGRFLSLLWVQSEMHDNRDVVRIRIPSIAVFFRVLIFFGLFGEASNRMQEILG